MSRAIVFIAMVLTAEVAFAQMSHAVKIVVKNKDTKAPISEAVVAVKETGISVTTNAGGVAELTNVPAGEQTIEVSSLGYDSAEAKLSFPAAAGTERTVYLEINNEV